MILAVARQAAAIAALLGLLASVSWFSVVAAQGLLGPGHARSTRALAALVLAHAELLAIFYLTGALRLFQLPVCGGLVVALALAAHRLGAGGEFAKTLHARWPGVRDDLRAAWKASGGVLRGLYAAIFAIATVRLLRASVCPPLATDAMLYHLVRAGLWVQAGEPVSFVAPDMWSFVGYFAPGGDLPWAWAMLPGRSDAWVGCASGLVWAETLVAGYALARTMRADRRDAVLGAALVATVPCVGVYMTSTYVDPALLTFFLASATFLGRATDEEAARGRTLALGVLSLALAFQVKFTGLLCLALYAPLALIREGKRLRLRTVGLGVLAVLPIGPPLVRNVLERGAPFYPFAVKLGPWVVSRGNLELSAIMTANIYPGVVFSWAPFLKAVFLPSLSPLTEHTGIGPVAPLLIVVGVACLLQHLARGPRTLPAYVLLATLVTLAPFASQETLAYRTGYAAHVSRLFLVAYAPLCVAVASRGTTWTRGLACVALAVQVLLFVPLGWGAVDVEPVRAAAALAVVFCLVAYLVFRWRVAWRVRAGFVAAAGVALGALLGPVRDAARYRYYAALNALSIYDVHPTGRFPPGTYRVWEALDGMRPLRIGTVFGWNGEGQNLYVSPLLGSHLQNTLRYFPITEDGSLVDYWRSDSVRDLANHDAWKARVLASDVDVLVTIPPVSVERAWIANDPSTFEPMVASDSGRYAAYRVRR